MSLRNGIWHGLRKDIILRNLIYGKWRIFVESLWLCEKLIDREKSRSLSWLFDCHPHTQHQKAAVCELIGAKKGAIFSLVISLSHSAYITFRIIISFRKPCHMPFRKLIPPFTLTVSEQIFYRKQSLGAPE